MAFTLQIQCPTIEDAERILDVLRNNPAGLTDAGGQGDEAAPVRPATGPDARSVEASDFSRPDEPEWMEAARRALRGVQEKYGTNDMTKPLEVLGRFGAGRISELRPRDVPAFVAACRWCGTPDRTDQGVTMP